MRPPLLCLAARLSRAWVEDRWSREEAEADVGRGGGGGGGRGSPGIGGEEEEEEAEPPAAAAASRPLRLKACKAAGGRAPRNGAREGGVVAGGVAVVGEKKGDGASGFGLKGSLGATGAPLRK